MSDYGWSENISEREIFKKVKFRYSPTDGRFDFTTPNRTDVLQQKNASMGQTYVRFENLSISLFLQAETTLIANTKR